MEYFSELINAEMTTLVVCTFEFQRFGKRSLKGGSLEPPTDLPQEIVFCFMDITCVMGKGRVARLEIIASHTPAWKKYDEKRIHIHNI